MNKQNKGKEVWVLNENKEWKKITIKEENLTEVVGNDGKRYLLKNVESVNSSKYDKSGDLASLAYLNEPSVLHTIKSRYDSGKMYTRSGIFMLSVNPYTYDIYPPQKKKQIAEEISRGTYKGDPHIYQVAQDAYDALCSTGENQSILVTGESGAGKTENTKLLVEYLGVDVNSEINKMLVMSNPILEAFGNAKTTKNDNSSRFGKFIQILFKDKEIVGGKIEKFVMELSRLFNTNPKEGNFHIFYQLLHCGDFNLLKSLHLDGKKPQDFEILKHGFLDQSKEECRKKFEQVRRGMKMFGISEMEVFSTLSAILYLSNVKFTSIDPSRNADLVELSPDSEEKVEIACKLLEISKVEFLDALLNPKIVFRGHNVKTDRSQNTTQRVLEAFMTSLYNENFSIILSAINDSLQKNIERDNYIGILDIAGFEIFDVNGYEQLMINYTNEKLQQLFNTTYFRDQQQIYSDEDIPWSFIDFGQDLQKTLDVIEARNPTGIISYCDEESVVPGGSDSNLIQKILTIKGVSKVKFNKNQFMLKHYAGDVIYTVEDWIIKNQNPGSAEMDTIFSRLKKTSEEGFLSSQSGIFRTLGQEHKEGLNNLMNVLKNTHPYFVRCIVPNLEKISNSFTSSLVGSQLRCNGVLEGLRIARIGYPTSFLHSKFYEDYKFIKFTGEMINEKGSLTNLENIHEGYTPQNLKELLSIMINRDKSITESDFVLGKSKIFFKQGVIAGLEQQKLKHAAMLSNILQAALRFKAKFLSQNLGERKENAVAFLKTGVKNTLELLKDDWWRVYLTVKPLSHIKNDEKKKQEEKKKFIDEINELKEINESHLNEICDLKKSGSAKIEEMACTISELKSKIEDGGNMMSGLINSKKEIQNTVCQKEEEIKTLIENQNKNQKKIADLKLVNSKQHAKFNELKHEKTKCVNDLEALTVSIKGKENEIMEKSKTIAELQVLISEKGAEATKKANDALARKNKEIEDIRETVNALREEKSELKKLISALENAKNEVVNRNTVLTEEGNDLKLKMDELRVSLEQQKIELSKIYKASEEEIRMLQEMVSKLKRESEESHNLNEMLTSDLNKSKAQVMKLKAVEARLEKENCHLQEKVTKLNNFVDENISKTQQGTADIEAEETKSADLQLKIEALEEMLAQTKAEKDRLYGQNMDLMDEKMKEFIRKEQEIKDCKNKHKNEMLEVRAENMKLSQKMAQLKEAAADGFSASRVDILNQQKQNLEKIAKLENENFELRSRIKGVNEDEMRKQIVELRAKINRIIKFYTEKFIDLIEENERRYRAELVGEGEEDGILVLRSKLEYQMSQQNKIIALFNAREERMKEYFQNIVEKKREKEIRICRLEEDFKKLSDLFIQMLSSHREYQDGNSTLVPMPTPIVLKEDNTVAELQIKIEKLKIKGNQSTRENNNLKESLKVLTEAMELFK